MVKSSFWPDKAVLSTVIDSAFMVNVVAVVRTRIIMVRSGLFLGKCILYAGFEFSKLFGTIFFFQVFTIVDYTLCVIGSLEIFKEFNGLEQKLMRESGNFTCREHLVVAEENLSRRCEV